MVEFMPSTITQHALSPFRQRAPGGHNGRRSALACKPDTWPSHDESAIRHIAIERRNPPPMRIATWNVNSLTARLQHVLDWLAANPVDVLCLQELKLTDDKFPLDVLQGGRLRTPRCSARRPTTASPS